MHALPLVTNQLIMQKFGDDQVKNQKLTPDRVITELKKNGISHIVWLPDSETNFMYKAMHVENTIDIIPICREGEALPIAAGLWVGGKKPIVMIQNTGLLESGDSLRGMGIDLNLPILMIIGYRGWNSGKEMTDTAGKFTEPMLNALGIKHYLIETNEDVNYISEAIIEAESSQMPVACLMGSEYS